MTDAIPDKEIIVPELIHCVNLTTGKPLQRQIVDPVFEGDGPDRRLVKPAELEDDGPWSLHRGLVIWVGNRPEWVKPLIKASRLTAFLVALYPLAPTRLIVIRGELWRPLRDTLQSDDFEIEYPYNMQVPPLFSAILEARDVAEEPATVEQPAADILPAKTGC